MKREVVLCVSLTLGFVVANVYITRPEPDNKKRTLVVEVREAGTDCPLPGALVQVSGIKRTVLTDSLGRVRFPAKVTLSQGITASCAGYENGADTPWLVAADTVEACLELVPTSPRTVAGTVEDGEGRLLSGARVWIATDTAMTDSVGRFVLGRTHVRPLDLQVFYPALPCCTRAVRLACHDTVAVRAALYDSMARGDIIGHVSNGWKGEAVIGALLTIRGTQFDTRTDAGGDYAFRGLRPGDYVIACLEKYGNLSKRVSVVPNGRARCDFHPRGVY